MRNSFIAFLIAGALLATTAFADGVKVPARPNKAEVSAPAASTTQVVFEVR